MKIDVPIEDDGEDQFVLLPSVNRCKRVLFRQSDCQLCMEICPTRAISLPFGPVLGETCINCGLCQAVCPTETFESLLNTDQHLREILQQQHDILIEDHKIHFHCHQAEKATGHSVAVNCLASITENSLLAMTTADVQEVRLNTGHCKECQLSEGFSLFKQSVDRHEILAAMLSLQPLSILRRQQQAERGRPEVTRRAFLQSLGKQVKKHTAKMVVRKEQQIRELLQDAEETDDQRGPAPRQQMLKALLQEHFAAEMDSHHSVENSTRWKMRVDAENCVACAICVNVCPTAALSKKIKGMELIRTINFSLCNNCGVCSEACPQGVIDFVQPYSIADFVSDNEEVVAKIALNACLVCGEIIPASEGELCTTCRKREVMPMFM